MTKRMVLIGFIIALPVLASAAVHVVDQGGTGDFTSLREAINGASAGDRVEVHPGRYAESCTVSVGLEIVGTGGSAVTILDGGHVRLIMWLRGADGCSISGLTFTGGYHDSGAAIHMSAGAGAAISDCVFRGNRATWDGGAIYTCQQGTRIEITNCLFEENYAYHNGGAMGINTLSYAAISESKFRGNTSATRSGAVGNHAGAHLVVDNCLFVHNIGGDSGALRSENASASITSCTFHENPASFGPSVNLLSESSVFEKNIVSNETPNTCFFSVGTHDFNVFYDRGGNAGSLDLATHEWYVDPGYCDFPADNFNLCSTSMGLPTNNGSHLLGRYARGCGACGPVAVEIQSWGSLKADYR